MVFSIFTAASTLLYHSKHSNTDQVETQRRLKLCIHWLSVLGKSWKSAGARQQQLDESESRSKPSRTLLTCGVFNVPKESQDLTSRTVPQWPPETHPPQSPSQRVLPAPPRVVGVGTPSSSLVPSPQDWGFLRDFGDSTDEFYEFDVQLRGLLDSGFEPDQLNFTM